MARDHSAQRPAVEQAVFPSFNDNLFLSTTSTPSAKAPSESTHAAYAIRSEAAFESSLRLLLALLAILSSTTDVAPYLPICHFPLDDRSLSLPSTTLAKIILDHTGPSLAIVNDAIEVTVFLLGNLRRKGPAGSRRDRTDISRSAPSLALRRVAGW